MGATLTGMGCAVALAARGDVAGCAGDAMDEPGRVFIAPHAGDAGHSDALVELTFRRVGDRI